MKRRVRIEQEADEDLASAVEYYRSEGGEALGLRFIEHAQEAFELPAREPGIGHVFSSAKAERLKSLRAWPLDEFPYVLFYEFDTKELRVYSVIHGKRDIQALLKGRFGE